MNRFQQYPEIVELRAEMAQFYRNLRRGGRPDMARLLHRRQRQAVEELSDKIFSMHSTDQRGGLSLISEAL